MTTQPSKPNKEEGISPLKLTISMWIGMLLVYIALVALWDSTSTKYKPTNLLDSQVKTPVNQEEWFIRRKNGI